MRTVLVNNRSDDAEMPDLSPLKVQDEFWHYATRCVICGRIDTSGKVPKFVAIRGEAVSEIVPLTHLQFLEECSKGIVGFAPCPTCEVMTIHELVAASMEEK